MGLRLGGREKRMWERVIREGEGRFLGVMEECGKRMMSGVKWIWRGRM